ncbi:hypothetical protein CPB85DRAFT_182399 [Mucidula mucida]|nr:hypothetical protein CPB85DRAFT_182399 [Mucidula mucida]
MEAMMTTQEQEQETPSKNGLPCIRCLLYDLHRAESSQPQSVMSTQLASFFSVDNDDHPDQEYLPFSEHTAEPTEDQDDNDPASFRPESISEPESPHFAHDSHPSPLLDSDAGAGFFHGEVATPVQPRVDSIHEIPSLLSTPHPAVAPASPTESASDPNPANAPPRLGAFFKSNINKTTPVSVAQTLPDSSHYNRAASPAPSSRSNATNTSTAAPPLAERVRVGVDQKSTLWEYYNREASDYDHDLFRGYRETLNSNLLVTTLFFGLVAAFLINALNVSPAEIYANALNQAVLVAVNISSNNTLPAEWKPITAAQLSPSPSSTGVISVTLWGSCVVICLGTMLFATSAKSWMVEYNRDMKNGNPFKCAQRRQLRYEELLKWRVETIISALPWFFQLSLFMFVIGFCFTLLEYHSTPGKVVIAMSCVVLGVYIITTVLPLFIPSCPYNTPAVVLFQRMSRLVSRSVQAGWLYLVKQISVVLASSNLTSGSWTLWSKDLSKSVPVHRVDSHEQQLLEKSDSALSWKAVTWLLTSSQNTATTDMALRSLWNLKYIPNQISVILPTKAPILLYSKLSVELAQREESFEPVDLNAPHELQAFLVSADITDFLASFLHLWKCISLDEIDSAEALARITGRSSYSRLHSELMNAWDGLKGSCKSFVELDGLGWPYHNLVAVIGTELGHFYVHPENFLQEKAEVKPEHPLADVKTLLQWHISDVKKKDGSMHLRHHSLGLLLDALAHALWRTDFAVLKEYRKDVLSLLVQLLGTLSAQDITVFMPLAACFAMFSDSSSEVKKSILIKRMNIRAQNTYRSDSNPDYLELAAAVHQTFKLYQQAEDYDSQQWQLILAFSSFADSTNTADGLVEELLIELPNVYVEKLVSRILDSPGSYKNLSWLLQVIFVFYSRKVGSLALKRSMLAYLQEILCFNAANWPNHKHQTRTILNILTFLKSELGGETSQKEEICQILILAMHESLQDPHRTVLRGFVMLELSTTLSTVLYTPEDISNLKRLLKSWHTDTEFHYSLYEQEVCTNMCTRYDV